MAVRKLTASGMQCILSPTCYHPLFGSLISPDALEYVDGMNVYAYVNGKGCVTSSTLISATRPYA